MELPSPFESKESKSPGKGYYSVPAKLIEIYHQMGFRLAFDPQIREDEEKKKKKGAPKGSKIYDVVKNKNGVRQSKFLDNEEIKKRKYLKEVSDWHLVDKTSRMMIMLFPK